MHIDLGIENHIFHAIWHFLVTLVSNRKHPSRIIETRISLKLKPDHLLITAISAVKPEYGKDARSCGESAHSVSRTGRGTFIFLTHTGKNKKKTHKK